MGLFNSIKKRFGEQEEQGEQSSMQSGIPASAPRVVRARLEALNELRDRGVISPEEYNRQRAGMLKGI